MLQSFSSQLYESRPHPLVPHVTEPNRVPVIPKSLPRKTRIGSMRRIRTRAPRYNYVVPLHQRVLAVAVRVRVQARSTANKPAVTPIDTNHVVRGTELDAVAFAIIVCMNWAVLVA